MQNYSQVLCHLESLCSLRATEIICSPGTMYAKETDFKTKLDYIYSLVLFQLPLELANDFCNSLGMKLASFETKREIECLADKIKSFSSKNQSI